MVRELDLVKVRQRNKDISNVSLWACCTSRCVSWFLGRLRSYSILEASILLCKIHTAHCSCPVLFQQESLLLLGEPLVWLWFAAEAIDCVVAGFGKDNSFLNLA